MVFYLTVIFFLGYGVLMVWLIWGWVKMPESRLTYSTTSEYFSILVPARNEASGIRTCLMDLVNQQFPKDRFEVIVIDDHSEDETPEVVKEVIREYADQVNLRLIHSSVADRTEFVAYKKQAIETGIAEAKGSWIVTTDADCFRGAYWLQALADFIDKHQPYMVSAPVAFWPYRGFFEKMQALEFMGLIGVGAASISNGKPNMCNGANLAYQKSRFYEIGGFTGVDHIASGDDEFLMHKMTSAYPGKVQFLKNREAVVYTAPLTGLKAFLSQRKRWVSKSRKYTRLSVSAVVFFVYGFHLWLIGSALLAFTGNWVSWGIPLSLFAVKVGGELLFLLPLSRFFGNRGLLPLYPLAAVFYGFYVVFIGIYGNMGGYEWKDRRLK